MLRTVVSFFESNQRASCFLLIHSGFLECLNAIPRMCSGKDLHVVETCRLENKSPKVGQHTIVNSILHFVNQQDIL